MNENKIDNTVLIDHIDEIILSTSEDAGLDEFKKSSEDDLCSYHHTVGRHFRNDLGLWENKTDLAKFFESINIMHGDDRSSILITSLHRKINSKPLEIAKQVKFYEKFWKECGCDMSGNKLNDK